MAPLLLVLLVAGCDRDEPAPAPSAEQSRQLDDTEAMLDSEGAPENRRQ